MIFFRGVPFANAMELDLHFVKHGAKFGLNTREEYEQMADAFMFGIMQAVTSECIRPSGIDRVRFHRIVRHFGVAHINPDYVRTFYPVKLITIANHGGVDGFFAYECGRVNL